MRWSLEVVFKDSKGNLGFGKYQMRNFASLIACTAITAMQYAENGGYPPTQNGDIRSLFWLFSLMALQN